ncbi:cytochrome b561 and DOMON domain-containing protein At4g17280 [Mercurialis annua]|uniref:cytochrome b561 and DOMON domain-containing protein At4g17280 n=1 Tax=Mercurialis annua TaxID=3986 RepID=UPI00215FA252|nr:cytochrome b561 and DOMON domain-containing protein At4g17280 [Mercurialis annua]
MEKYLNPMLCLTILMSMIMYTCGQTCSSYKFSSNQLFSACNDLPFLNAYLHWNYNSSSRQLQIAYRHAGVLNPNRWVAWAINPTSTGMLGSQAIVAYQQSDGGMRVYTSPVSSYRTSLSQGKLSFGVSDLSATFSGNEITIFGTLDLSSIGSTTINQVWQEGPVSSDSPQIHPTSGPNVQSMGTVNLLSGTVASTGGNGRTNKRNVHGVLNAISWGILMPVGALVARYLKVFKSAHPAWFYIHVGCQFIAYTVGVAGWGTGLKLGSESSSVQYNPHRTIGIILFILGTLQVFALLLRPKPEHKYRFYWKIYHHTVGYVVILLSIINIFKGFNILNPAKTWKNAYIGIIVVLAIIAVWLEGYTWYIVIKRRRSENDAKMQHGQHQRV